MDRNANLFEPLHYKEKIRVLNPRGTVGILTLWSDVAIVVDRLAKAGIDLSVGTSNICAIGNLYGEGFKHLLRNLLNNPQVDTLVVIGTDRNRSYSYLRNFFELGTEPVNAKIEYERKEGQTILPVRVSGTDYIMDDLVRPDMFLHKPNIIRIDGLDSRAFAGVAMVLRDYRRVGGVRPRLVVPVPRVRITQYPSNVRTHTIIADGPLEAWKYLVQRLMRFGARVSIRKGERLELQNVKVVVDRPQDNDKAHLAKYGFDKREISSYEKQILTADIPNDVSYSYGNRLRSYFGLDLIAEATKRVNEVPDERRAYLSLWDNRCDMFAEHRPCLVSIFFRRTEDALHMTATFRSHNAAKAWLTNCYGLIAVLKHVAAKAGVAVGSLTVVSMSISLDPQSLEGAKRVHDEVSSINKIREDPNGYFTIRTEGRQIVVQHTQAGIGLGEYRGDNPERLQNELARNLCLSDINHAMYLGRQLEKAHRCIQDGVEYTQDS